MSTASVLLFLVLWSTVTEVGLISRKTIPSPRDLVAEFTDLVREGYSGKPLWRHVGASVVRTFLGLLCAIVIGTPIGLLIGHSRGVSAVLEPFFSLVRPMPAIAFIPLVILYFGIGEFSKIVLIFFTSMLHMILHAAAGVKSVPAELLRVALNFGLTSRQLFLSVILPAAMPHVMTGIRTTTAISWALVVAAELVGAQEGLGYIVMDAATFFRLADIYIGIALIGLIGFTLEIVEKRVEARVLHWRGR
ncbi:MAG: ABC transporter permease [Candidatus Rokubacteria bacterium]|nr:ABC transporter permease [Candidatus Rokubacteria bacterium]